ncbi:MAG: hypothetical protein ACPIOQ_50490 [Promethearchaeia archaeon]
MTAKAVPMVSSERAVRADSDLSVLSHHYITTPCDTLRCSRYMYMAVPAGAPA